MRSSFVEKKVTVKAVLNSFGGLVGFSIYTACVVLLEKFIPAYDVVSSKAWELKI
jgi:hypothetical protein